MFRIANALEQGNPFAYLLIVMIFIPPICIIMCSVWDWVANKIHGNRKKKVT